jgi:hypothetical protein
MELIDFLKYGAIGISLALAILSYRLLTKEQDKTDVRIPMLKSIRNYFILAVFLSVFFGLLELSSKVFLREENEQNIALVDIWESHFSEFPDSTLQQKISRISNNLYSKEKIIDTSEICSDIYEELENCRKELETFDRGFYQNVIKLKKAVSQDPDGWINIEFQTKTKPEVINSLKGIFKSLGENYDNLTDEDIVLKWKSFKSKWSNEKLGYIFHSDVSEIVKEFLEKYN